MDLKIEIDKDWLSTIAVVKQKLRIKDPLLTMTLCAPNETKDKGHSGQKGFSDNTKVDFGAKKDHG